jgi:hypothetical protein
MNSNVNSLAGIDDENVSYFVVMSAVTLLINKPG